jgi:lysophospholipase L1-like esterase
MREEENMAEKAQQSKFQEVAGKIYFTFYNAGKRSNFKKENRTLTQDPVVFFGDSITDYCDLKTYYPEYVTVNRGISGNTTTDLLNRMQVSVYDAHPSEVVLLIGINDMMNEGNRPSEVAPRYEQIVKQIREHCPKAKLVCQSVYPGWKGDPEKANMGMTFPLDGFAADILELNGYIKKICEKYDCVYADIHAVLRKEDDTMVPDYSFDGCHPNADGYQVISAELKKYL